MNVLIIQPWIRLGGAELISVHLADELQRRGHKVAIACTFLDPTGTPEETHRIEYLLPNRTLSDSCRRHRSLFLMLGPWLMLGLVWRYSAGVDVLNPHNFPALWVATLVGALRGIPVVWTCNEAPERLPWRDAFHVGFGDYVGWLVASSWIDRVLARRAAKVYVPSELTRNQVQTRYRIDPTVVRPGVSPFYQAKSKLDGMAKSFDLDRKYVLLCVGKLHPQKNQIICIEALRRILPQIPNAVLVLAGDGPMAKEWASEAIRLGLAGQVRFLGNKTPSEVRKLYGLCDLNLFPPTNQSWGLTPFEALCAEKPSIVSNDCGAAEVLVEQGIGIVCDPSPVAFAQRILEVHENPGRYRAMARKGRRYVMKSLSWTQYVEKVLKLMEHALLPAEDRVNESAQEVVAQ